MDKNVGDILSTNLRRVLYIVFAVIGVGFGATQTAFVTAETAAPLWLSVAFQVYLYIGGAFGLLAATNTVTPTASVVTSEDVSEIIEATEVSVEVAPLNVVGAGNTPKHADV